MFFAVGFPFSDSRYFLAADTDRVPYPQWPLPIEGKEFIRSFGQVRRRRAGGVESWAGEERFCGASRAIRFEPALTKQHLAESTGFPTGVYRRFYWTGFSVSRMEVGIKSTYRDYALDATSVLKRLNGVCSLQVRTPSKKLKPTVDLISCGPALADHYLKATTRRRDGTTIQHLKWWHLPCTPLLVVEYWKGDILELPRFSTPLPLPGFSGQLHHCWIDRHRQLLPVWFLEVSTKTDLPLVRQIRVHLLRMHAEWECLKSVLRLISNKQIEVRPRTEASDRLQEYLLGCHRLLNRTSAYGQVPSQLLIELQRFSDLVSPSEREVLLSQLSGIRKNVLGLVAGMTKPRSEANSHVHVVASTVVFGNVQRIGGDTVTSYNVSISGTNISVGDIVVAENIQNSFNRVSKSSASEEVKTKLETLHKQVADLVGQLPPEKAKTAADDLEVFSREAISAAPRRKWYELSAEGLIEAASTVAKMAAPITATVKSILGILGMAAGAG